MQLILIWSPDPRMWSTVLGCCNIPVSQFRLNWKALQWTIFYEVKYYWCTLGLKYYPILRDRPISPNTAVLNLWVAWRFSRVGCDLQIFVKRNWRSERSFRNLAGLPLARLGSRQPCPRNLSLAKLLLVGVAVYFEMSSRSRSTIKVENRCPKVNTPAAQILFYFHLISEYFLIVFLLIVNISSCYRFQSRLCQLRTPISIIVFNKWNLT